MPEPSKPSAAWGWLLALALLGGTQIAPCQPVPSPDVPSVVTVDPVPEPGKLTIAVAGDKEAAPGVTVELAAKGNADRVHWSSEAVFRGPYEGGKVIVFSSPVPGRFVFTLAGADADEIGQVVHVVTVGPPLPPSPIPVPPAPIPPVDPTVRPNRATYIYESRQGAPPPPVLAALSKLNVPGGFVASAIDQHVLTGKGQIPVQYYSALEAAKKAGIPCLVIESASGVLRVVKSPQTAKDVTDAVSGTNP